MLFNGSTQRPLSKAMTGSVAFAMFCQLYFAAGASANNGYSQHSPDFDPFAEHAAVVAGSAENSNAVVRAAGGTMVRMAAPAGAVTSRPLYSPVSSLPPVAPPAPTASPLITPVTSSVTCLPNSSVTASTATSAPLGFSATNGTLGSSNGDAYSTSSKKSKLVKGSASRYQAKSGRPRCHGDAVLPMMVHMARRPELIESKYLRTILGAPDNRGSSAFGMSSLNWRARQIGAPSFALQNGTLNFANKQTIAVAHPSATSKTLVAMFPHSGLQLKDIKKQLGEPTRQYFDNNAQPVESYQLSPNAVLTFTEPVNCFDVTQMAVVYNGAPTALPSAEDYAVANQYRLTVARQHLASGDTIGCAELLNEHLKDNPLDAGAHLILAKTMKHYGDINGSIDEYKNALNLARTYGVSSVEKEAYSALSMFGVVAPASNYSNANNGNQNSNLGAPNAVAGKKVAGRSAHRS
ncbi:hypothetical protein BH11CYA1_BH11CYA1_48530 [soil metagenome]